MMSTGDVHAWRTVQAFFSQVPASLSRTASCTSGVWTAGLGRWGVRVARTRRLKNLSLQLGGRPGSPALALLSQGVPPF